MRAGSQPSAPAIAVAQGEAGQPSPADERARRGELAGVAPRAGALLIDGILLALLVAPVRLVASLIVSTLVPWGSRASTRARS